MSITHRWMASWRDERPAITTPSGETLSFGELKERVGRAASWLQRQGLVRGDLVALQMPKTPLFLELCMAAWAGGIAVLPLNDRYTPDEVVFACTDAGAKLAVLARPAPLSVPMVAVEGVHTRDLPPDPLETPQDLEILGAILYTSGTTGRPKGARLRQRNLAAMVDALHQAWAWRADDVLLHALPLYHVHGLFVAAAGALRAGAHQVWHDRFDAEAVLDALVAHQVTLFMGVPTFYHRLLQVQRASSLDHVRLFTSGSAPLPAHVHRAFAERFGHAILERYGMTEVGIVVSNPYDGERRPGSVGMPLPGVELRVDAPAGEIGEVWIRGPSVFEGYHRRPEETAQALEGGWMHTGDQGWIDPDGYLHLVGRRSDLVLTGGFNVYPGEVEAALAELPGVSEIAVFGVPDDDLGEIPVAAYVGDLDPSDLIGQARRSLAPYKVPRRAHRLEALPRNSMGKVQKNTLRRRFAPVIVRQARPDERDAITRRNLALALETEGITLDPEVTARGVARVLDEDVGAFYLVAEIDGEAVGQLMITREWSDWRCRWIWWIQSVYVEEAYRGRGVYRALHDAVRDRARRAGAAGVRLYVDRRNARAAAVYAHLGMNGEHYDLFEQMLDYAGEPGDG